MQYSHNRYWFIIKEQVSSQSITLEVQKWVKFAKASVAQTFIGEVVEDMSIEIDIQKDTDK